MTADPANYDAWYRTPRGRWIGETEYQLLYRQMAPRPGETILDAGCGTGYFSRRFAHDGHFVTGLDIDPAAVAFAHASMRPPLPCVVADMTALPFADRSFDCAISVTALCFVEDEVRALKEIIRVARRRFALGLLNRASLLHLKKSHSTGSYTGARWHHPSAVAAMLGELPVEDITVASAIFVPWGGTLAQAVERIAPNGLPWGSFIAVSGSIAPADDATPANRSVHNEYCARPHQFSAEHCASANR